MFKLIPNWHKKNLTCYFCGGKKSVKYEVPVVDIDGNERMVTCCNNPKCVICHINSKQGEE